MEVLNNQALHNQANSFQDELTVSLTSKTECNNNYSVKNDESLRGHCTNERRVRKQDKKVRRDVI